MSPGHGTQLDTLLLPQTALHHPALHCTVLHSTAWQYGCITPDKLLPPAGVTNTILDTRISGLLLCPLSVTLRLPPMDSVTRWTGELWLKTNILK